jgi:hemerythrin
MNDAAVRRGSYAVGVESIDLLHEELEQRLADLQEADADPGPALAALIEHLRRHFAHEEGLMAGGDFPMASCHAREHVSVIEVVTEVQRLLAEGDAAPLARLAPAMFEWFALHATGMDAALASWLQRSSSHPA